VAGNNLYPHDIERAAENVDGVRKGCVIALRVDAARCPFLAGQAVLIARRGYEPRRPYSIASAPADLQRDGTIEFLVAVDDQGQPGEHLAGLRPGDELDVEGPMGEFVLGAPPPGAPLAFFAGGTGIAPLRAMWRQALADVRDARVTLVYSARTQGHLAFADELGSMARAGAARVSITLTREAAGSDWTGRRGRVDAALVASSIDAARSHAFVCGPPAFVDHVAARLREAGLDAGRIHLEGW